MCEERVFVAGKREVVGAKMENWKGAKYLDSRQKQKFEQIAKEEGRWVWV